jgi:hypothetical protein
MSIERKKYECSALPKGWQREEVIRKSGLSAGKVDVYYYRYMYYCEIVITARIEYVICYAGYTNQKLNKP